MGRLCGCLQYIGGEAFYIIPRVVAAPEGSQFDKGYTTPLWQESMVYASEPNGLIDIFYNGSIISDLQTGAYNVYIPATVPGTYTIAGRRPLPHSPIGVARKLCQAMCSEASCMHTLPWHGRLFLTYPYMPPCQFLAGYGVRVL